jgi:para-nitrobenzyl esterase
VTVTCSIVIVATASGRIEGVDLDGTAAWLGVPYATARRWQAPEPIARWTGARAATAFAPGPPQPQTAVPGGATLPGLDADATDEDCLFLNVWSPPGAASAPVLVWLPGGAFVGGSASLPIYDGSRMAARRGVVVVTVTYRVGALGFAAIPGRPPNRGLLDQVAALRWVRDNIDAFGGDPANVTVFGESAGGGSIVHQLAMPSARHLFRRAIVQSGATDKTLTPDVAGAVAQRFLATLTDDAEKASVDQILAAQGETLFSMFAEVGAMPFHPFVDGEVVASRPIEALRAGATADIALLIGTTRDEMRMFLDPSASDLDRDRLTRRAARYLTALGAPDADDAAAPLVELYDGDPHVPTPSDVWSAIQTDGEMRRPADAVADAHTGPTFGYRFDAPLAGALARHGACHGCDLPYPFGTIDRSGWREVVGPGASAVSDAMQSAWAAFARDGDPSCDELGSWPEFGGDRRATMLLATEPALVDDPDGERRRRWAAIAPMR